VASSASDDDFKPALRFAALTSLFDPLIATVGRERAFKQRVLAHAAIAPGEAVLDLGCGTGTLALMAHAAQPGATCRGLDPDPAILRRARDKAVAARAPVAFDQGFADALPYPDGRFDVVLSTLVFHHLHDDVKQRAGAEIRRVLKPGGRFVLADFGRPHDPLMRLVAAATVQLLDGRATTSLNIAGRLPALLADAGLAQPRVVERLRTPAGTIEIVCAGRAPEPA
jgi:ubiquinone/menaquinone biosynthesis C-methylase UbiE